MISFRHSNRTKKILVIAMLFILIVILIIGIILAMYSYLVEIKGVNNEIWSLSRSPYNFNSKFFNSSTYNLNNFPQITSLLNSLKVGLIMIIVSGTIITNYLVIHWLIRIGKLKIIV